jgi:hypothetical protein
MTENQDYKKIEDYGENLLYITNEYIKNERPKNESKNILNIAVKKMKSRTIALLKRL